MDDKNLRGYMAELIGTFALVFVSSGMACVAVMGGLQPVALLVAIATGLIYAVMLAVTLPLSGGYLNPAIVVTFWVFRRLDTLKACALIGVQVLSSLIAGLALRSLLFLFDREDVLVATRLGTPHLDLTTFGADTFAMGIRLKGIGIELVLTFIVVFTIYGTLLDPRAPRWFGAGAHRLGALWVGLVVLVATLVGFSLTGAALNPARWIGPALAQLTDESLRLQGPFNDHAVYWIGPIAGALLAGWAYTALILPVAEEEAVASRPASAVGTAPTKVSSTLFRARK